MQWKQDQNTGIVATVHVQTVMTLFLSTGYFTFTWLTTAVHV